MTPNYPNSQNYNKNKKKYLELLKKRSEGDTSNYSELLRYSFQLEQQVEWELREQYLDLMEDFLKDKISMAEFFSELQTKNYAIINIIPILESHRILLSLDKKAPKFYELMEPINAELEGDLSYTENEFRNFIQENFIKIKKYLKEE